MYIYLDLYLSRKNVFLYIPWFSNSIHQTLRSLLFPSLSLRIFPFPAAALSFDVLKAALTAFMSMRLSWVISTPPTCWFGSWRWLRPVATLLLLPSIACMLLLFCWATTWSYVFVELTMFAGISYWSYYYTACAPVLWGLAFFGANFWDMLTLSLTALKTITFGSLSKWIRICARWRHAEDNLRIILASFAWFLRWFDNCPYPIWLE